MEGRVLGPREREGETKAAGQKGGEGLEIRQPGCKYASGRWVQAGGLSLGHGGEEEWGSKKRRRLTVKQPGWKNG